MAKRVDERSQAAPNVGTSLASFFADEEMCRQALDAYRRFADEYRWSIKHKLELYQHARRAFGGGCSPEEAYRAFEPLYIKLRGWQVFRGAQGKCWSARQTFDRIREDGRAISRQRLSLRKLKHTPGGGGVNQALCAMAKLKRMRSGDWPSMAVSKFLHFANPAAIPIYDTAVVGKQVFQAFKGDYLATCAKYKVQPLWARQEGFLYTYLLWAGHTLSEQCPRFLSIFAEWFREQVRGADDPEGVLDEIATYEATAFEFVAIGATQILNQDAHDAGQRRACS